MLGAARRHVNQVAHVAETVSFSERLGERGLTLIGGWASRARCRTLKRTGRPGGGASTALSASRCADACPATELGLSDALRGPGTAESSASSDRSVQTATRGRPPLVATCASRNTNGMMGAAAPDTDDKRVKYEGLVRNIRLGGIFLCLFAIAHPPVPRV